MGCGKKREASASKIATLVSELVVENLPLDRTAILVPVFEVKDLPLDRIYIQGASKLGRQTLGPDR